MKIFTAFTLLLFAVHGRLTAYSGPVEVKPCRLIITWLKTQPGITEMDRWRFWNSANLKNASFKNKPSSPLLQCDMPCHNSEPWELYSESHSSYGCCKYFYSPAQLFLQRGVEFWFSLRKNWPLCSLGVMLLHILTFLRLDVGPRPGNIRIMTRVITFHE